MWQAHQHLIPPAAQFDVRHWSSGKVLVCQTLIGLVLLDFGIGLLPLRSGYFLII